MNVESRSDGDVYGVVTVVGGKGSREVAKGPEVAVRVQVTTKRTLTRDYHGRCRPSLAERANATLSGLARTVNVSSTLKSLRTSSRLSNLHRILNF